MSTLLATPIDAVTFAVVDTETTSFDKDCEIVEIAVAVVSLKRAPEIVLDTVVRPLGRMGGTHVHGLSYDEALEGPEFVELLLPLKSLFANRVMAGHNAAFDFALLERNFSSHGFGLKIPYVCTMELNGVIGWGPQWSLKHACGARLIPLDRPHEAAQDAMATAYLLRHLLAEFQQRDVQTLGDLTALARGCGFVKSLAHGPISTPPHVYSEWSCPAMPRHFSVDDNTSRFEAYRNRVLKSVRDISISEETVRELSSMRDRLGLSEDAICAAHAMVAAAALRRYAEDERVDVTERVYIRRLFASLKALGWSPGD